MTAVCECGPHVIEGRDGRCMRCRKVVPFDGYVPGGLGCLVALALGLIAWVCIGVVVWTWVAK